MPLRFNPAPHAMTANSAWKHEPIDLVYTWVDDRFEGYSGLLHRYARNEHDRNPNRTRDNLDLLRYSLRSVERYMPWVRNVYLFSMRPQVPHWLSHGAGLRVVHHDEVIDPVLLPTFNSFAIISYLHRLPDLSQRFLYFEDDMLLTAPVARSDFFADDGCVGFYPRLGFTCADRDVDTLRRSPWDGALATCNHLLDAAFGPRRRHPVNHVPLMIDRTLWQGMEQLWSAPFAHTRASRFRAHDNIAPEYLYPYYAVANGSGFLHPRAISYRRVLYHPLENILPWAWLGAGLQYLLRPRFLTLNDNLGACPDQRVVAFVQRFLARRYPHPSRFECHAG